MTTVTSACALCTWPEDGAAGQERESGGVVAAQLAQDSSEVLLGVVSREEKYKAKAFDTFVYRAGDVVGAQTEGLLSRLGIGLVALASVAVPIAIVWATLGFWLGRVQRRMAAR